MKNQLLATLCIFVFLITSCKTNLLVIEDLVPRAKQHDFQIKFTQPSFTSFSLDLKVSYEIRNPYKSELPVPSHKMGIYVNDENTGMAVEHIEVKVPAKSSLILDYPFSLNSKQLIALMGKNNKITFHSSIELDLSEFSDMLPNYKLAVTDEFDFETSSMAPMLKQLTQNKIGKYTLEVEHGTFIKVPALPTISASSLPVEITLLGAGIDLINLNAIKNGLIPFGDLLINGELDGLKDPFIDAVVNSTVTIPAPTATEWFKTRQIKMETQVINLLRPIDPGIQTKWNNVKATMYQSTTIPATTFFIDNFMTPYVNSNASSNWNTFQNAYNQFKTVVLPDQLPGPQTRGFELAIPFSFRNNNEFPISIPIFRSSVVISGGQPFTMYVRPKNMGQIPLNQVPSNIATIDGNKTETLYVVFSFDMQAFSQGIYTLFSKSMFEPNLKGIVSYDFGYGPMYVGYDLMNLDLNYK
jgi:LEA14-like dessication related protein